MELARSASVTTLRAGDDYVIASGLCGRLRAWQLSPPSTWRLVLDENSLRELANAHTTCSPYRYVSEVSDDGRWCAATTKMDASITVWSIRTWKKLCDILLGDERARQSPSCVELDGLYVACGSREGWVHVWRDRGGRAAPDYARAWPSMRADRGPVASVVLAPDMVVAA